MHRGTFIALGFFGVAAFVPVTADAAVTVLGNGLAQSCFTAAEFSTSPRDGIADCTMALEQTALSPRDRAATYINRGILYSRVDEAAAAIDDYNQGLSIAPEMGEGYVDRGAAYIVLGRYSEALQDVDKGISLGSNRLQIAYYDRAIIQEAMGNVRGAYDDYKKATEIEPDFALAVHQLERFKVVRHHADGT